MSTYFPQNRLFSPLPGHFLGTSQDFFFEIWKKACKLMRRVDLINGIQVVGCSIMKLFGDNYYFGAAIEAIPYDIHENEAEKDITWIKVKYEDGESLLWCLGFFVMMLSLAGDCEDLTLVDFAHIRIENIEMGHIDVKEDASEGCCSSNARVAGRGRSGRITIKGSEVAVDFVMGLPEDEC